MKIFSYAGVKMNTKRLKGFTFWTLIGHFQVMLWQWSGWYVQDTQPSLYTEPTIAKSIHLQHTFLNSDFYFIL